MQNEPHVQPSPKLETTPDDTDSTRHSRLSQPFQIVFALLSLASIGFAVFYIFGLSLKGIRLAQWSYYYILIALMGSAAFLVIPGRKKDQTLPWYDTVAAILVFAICVYFSTNSTYITWGKWASPSGLNLVLAILMALLVLEAARRVAGPVFLSICIVFGFYPLFAGAMPGILSGYTFSFQDLMGSLVFSESGLMGLPTSVLGEMLIGFLLFAGFLIATGAGKFFLNLSLGLMGRYRGGPAKVAVISSGFFGSLTGSVISNIVSTGSVTIPAMKRIGYPAHYAGAIETCASTGGAIMPPVMGAVAFIMAQVMGIEYSTIIIAAIIPALLYYFGLIMQVDAFAARTAIEGLPPSEIPSLKKTMAEGWHFIGVLIFLIWGLLYMRWEELTPFYATALLCVLSMFRKDTRLTPRRFIRTIAATGRLICTSMVIILPIGFILNGLVITGMSGAFAANLVYLGGSSMILVLILGVVACFIMGMAGLVICAYLFLAITLAPALTKLGDFNPLSIHMFLLYYTNLGMITPPVAVASFVGAAVAKAPPMKTAFKSMTLGIVLYFIPFFFLFNPSLILNGSLVRSIYLFILCLIGIVFIAAGLEGYLIKIGKLRVWERIPLVLAGFLIGLPEWKTTIIGFIMTAVLLLVSILFKPRERLLFTSKKIIAPIE